MTTFITKIEDTLKADAVIALNAAKASAAYVEGVFVEDVEPELLSDLSALIKTFGTALLSSLFKQILPGATVTVPTPASTDQAAGSA